MCAQKTRPIDAFQRIMTSFKHFENKLDKLQEDVNSHGKTLTELRGMVTILSKGTILSVDSGNENNRRPPTKTSAMQSEDKAINLEESKIKRRNSVQPLTPALKVKSYQSQKSKLSPQTSPFQVHGNKLESGPKGISQKHVQRHRKADAQRKTNTLRNQKMAEKKRTPQAK